MSLPGVRGAALDFLQFDSRFKKAVQFIFGGTLIVDDLVVIAAINREVVKLVTADGAFLEKSGIWSGGFQEAVASGRKMMIFDEASDDQTKAIAVLQAKIAVSKRQIEEQREELNRVQVETQVLETKIKGLGHDLADLGRARDKIDSEIKEITIAPADIERYLKNLLRRKEEIERQLADKETHLAPARQKIDLFNLEEDKKRRELFRLQETLQKQQQQLDEFNQLINEIKIALARVETKKEDWEKEVRQEMGGIDKGFDEEINNDFNADQAWFEIGKLKRELEQIGGLDPEIAKEHQEASERYEFLTAQTQDLEKAISDLDKVVRELETIIAQQFDASFKKINSSFAKYFVKIFGGGRAKLEIVQRELPEHPQSTAAGMEATEQESVEIADAVSDASFNIGIDIMVSPQNKKVSNIAALSGGERTMTSLALICAIIENNPSPFIVMDEVDAALDEANSEKFAAILQELSYKSQFVVITHNRVIMHVADALYGVAMADDGISKTLSLQLSEAAVKNEK